jgi:hypothetical protein
MCASAPALKLLFKRYLKGSAATSGATPGQQGGYSHGSKPQDAEKGPIEFIATDTSFHFGSEPRKTDVSAISAVSTFIGCGSDPEIEGWSGLSEWKNAGDRVENFALKHA